MTTEKSYVEIRSITQFAMSLSVTPENCIFLFLSKEMYHSMYLLPVTTICLL